MIVLDVEGAAAFLKVSGVKSRRDRLIREEFSARFADVVEGGHRNPEQFGVDVIDEIFGTGGPLRGAELVELRQDKFPHVSGRDDVGKEEADHFAPDDMLAT